LTRHIFIPDTQVQPGVPMEHLDAAGKAIMEYRPDVVVHIGDHWDMPSLNSYEKSGSKFFHDKSYKADIEAGKEGMERLLGPLNRYNERRIRNRKKPYQPRLVFLTGNHEYRIARAVHNDPVLEDTIGYHDLELEEMGWEVYPYQRIVDVDGVWYCHNFVNQDSLKKSVLGGTIENKLQKIGNSFSMGHQQTFQFGSRHNAIGQTHMGLVWGTFYMHEEEYLGEQGNNSVHGIMVKNEVKDGFYCPMMLSLDYLLNEFK